MSDQDVGGNPSSHPHFSNKDDQRIFCKYWILPENKKGLIMIVHGFGEHCERYDPVAEVFTKLGLIVFSHDHVGHGKSEGHRCDISSYEQYLRDLKQHVDIMKEKYPDLPLYLFGHSMGGGLAILLAHRNPDLFKAVLLSSPLIAKNALLKSSFKAFLLRNLSPLVPRLPVGYLNVNAISRSTDQVTTYKTDPLVYHGAILLRTAYQLSCMSDDLEISLPDITFPFIVLHGEKDELCDIDGSRRLVQNAKSEDKTLKEFKDAYHELLHEIDDIPGEYLQMMESWLQERM